MKRIVSLKGALTAATGVLAAVALATSQGAAVVPTAGQAAQRPSNVAIPTPESFFGFSMGAEGKLASYPKVLDYLRLADDKSDRVTYQRIGATTNGNEYGVAFISSPDNIANLDRLVRINKRLASGKLSERAAERLSHRGVPFYLIQPTIHSTEVMNGQAIPDIVHRLTTEDSAFTDEVLDNAVLMVVPSQNPDGQHLVVDYFNETEGTDYRRVYPDLYHHYTGHDDNRDWFMLTQIETRYFANLVAKYKPVAVQQMHGQGPSGERMFTPPYRDPIDPTIHPLARQQTNALGTAIANGLTADGKDGVMWDTGYDEWSPSLSYSFYHGAPAILTEIAAAQDLAYTYTSRDGEPLGPQDTFRTNLVDPYDESTWTLAQAVDYAETSVYAGLENVAKYHESYLYGLHAISNSNRSLHEEADVPYAYVLPKRQQDDYATYEMLQALELGQVEIRRATEPFQAGGKRYRAGSYVLLTDQPYGRWLQDLMKIWDYPTKEQCAECEPYDVTGHTLWMFFGVDTDIVDEPFDASLKLVRNVRPKNTSMPADPGDGGAYLVSPESYGADKMMVALQHWIVPTFRASDDFRAGGHRYPAGTLVVPATDRSRYVLERESAATGVQVRAVSTPPDVSGVELKPGTRVGLFRGIGNMPGGWMMWLFDQYDVRYDVMTHDDFDHDLNALYDTIVLPHGISKDDIVEGISAEDYPDEFAWAHGVGDAGWQRLHEFVEDGGTLLAFGNSVETADELVDLPIEAVIPDDSNDVDIPGSLLAQRYDTDNPVAWGMRSEWPTWFRADQAYTVTDPGAAEVVSSYPESGELLRSGYAAGEDVLHGAANVIHFDVGDGEVVTYGSEVVFRTWPRSSLKLLFNPMYNGPAEEVTANQLQQLRIKSPDRVERLQKQVGVPQSED